MSEPQVGDVALDLTQGRPVHILRDTGQTAAEWSEANDYDLVGNYGNSRLDATADDRVYDVVYCSSAQSEPSKTYAMPASRLLRVETEAADDGAPVAERVRREVVGDLLREAHHVGNGDLAAAVEGLLSAVVGEETIAAAAPEVADDD